MAKTRWFRALVLMWLWGCATELDAQQRIMLMDTTHTFSARWELEERYQQGTFLITPYKPVFIMPFDWSNNPNVAPTSENPDYTWTFDDLPLNAVEAKFQLSFKTKIAQGLFNGHGDIWAAYTQTSRWQVYNELSRPFRESNFEPEFILSFATNYRVLGFKASMASVSLNHQSNGRAAPVSRSWNRVIFMFSFEKPNWTILFRPWIRIPDTDDENPDITSTLGSGEIIVIKSFGKHQVSAQLRNTFDFVLPVKGSFQFDWAFPIMGRLQGYTQIFYGYGESMIDYNHLQARIGFGVALLMWK